MPTAKKKADSCIPCIAKEKKKKAAVAKRRKAERVRLGIPSQSRRGPGGGAGALPQMMMPQQYGQTILNEAARRTFLRTEHPVQIIYATQPQQHQTPQDDPTPSSTSVPMDIDPKAPKVSVRTEKQRPVRMDIDPTAPKRKVNASSSSMSNASTSIPTHTQSAGTLFGGVPDSVPPPRMTSTPVQSPDVPASGFDDVLPSAPPVQTQGGLPIAIVVPRSADLPPPAPTPVPVTTMVSRSVGPSQSGALVEARTRATRRPLDSGPVSLELRRRTGQPVQWVNPITDPRLLMPIRQLDEVAAQRLPRMARQGYFDNDFAASQPRTIRRVDDQTRLRIHDNVPANPRLLAIKDIRSLSAHTSPAQSPRRVPTAMPSHFSFDDDDL